MNHCFIYDISERIDFVDEYRICVYIAIYSSNISPAKIIYTLHFLLAVGHFLLYNLYGKTKADRSENVNTTFTCYY